MTVSTIIGMVWCGRAGTVLAVCGTVLAAVVGTAPAAGAAAPRVPPAADSAVLPQIAAAPPEGGGCVKPSARRSSLAPWPQQYLDPSRAWELSRGGGTTVAVVDTGVDARHVPALAGRVTAGPDTAADEDGAAGIDCIGHGTFVAGLIAAARRPGTAFAGVAPDARVLAVRVTGKDGTATADHVAAGIRAAVRGGARVVDVPLALEKGSAKLTAAAEEAERRGAVVVAPAYPAPDGAAGSADNPPPAAYPAALPTVLAVAALGPGGAPEQSRPSRTAPDLAAPGISVMSVGPGGSGNFTGSGADLATAFVAGTAALVDGYRPGLSAARVRDRLTGTAYRSASGRALVGAGTLDPEGAVTAVAPTGDPAAARSARPAAVRMPNRPGHAGHSAAYAVAGGAAALVAGTVFLAATLPRARRRRWRPGTSPPG